MNEKCRCSDLCVPVPALRQKLLVLKVIFRGPISFTEVTNLCFLSSTLYILCLFPIKHILKPFIIGEISV